MLCNTLLTKGEHFQAPKTHLSQVSETEQKSVHGKRTATFRFTEHQLSVLKKRFKSDRYITGEEKKLMAETLGVTQDKVQNWFYTQRKRIRNQSVKLKVHKYRVV